MSIQQVHTVVADVNDLIDKYEQEAKKCGSASEFKVYAKIISDLRVLKLKAKK